MLSIVSTTKGLKTIAVVGGVPYEIKTLRREGESSKSLTGRHFANVVAYVAQLEDDFEVMTTEELT